MQLTWSENDFYGCFTSKMIGMWGQSAWPDSITVGIRALKMGFYYPMSNLMIKVITNSN
jgi:hypothetical protein